MEAAANMDTSSSDGLGLNQSKSSKLSMEEKRELVYALSKWSHGAPEVLQSWTRHEILEVLCAEMGKERKYTGLTKMKIIEHLLKLVSGKNMPEHAIGVSPEPRASPEVPQKSAKRSRKSDNPTRLSLPTNTAATTFDVPVTLENVSYCKNSACKARLLDGYSFCKRCSCCICQKYDDNKDPSLWLNCSSDPPFEGVSCGMSFHLECALRHERAGVIKDRLDKRLDGSFYCVSCGKVNDILGSCKKQLVLARDTRRVDILCYRVSLCRKILNGTEIYKNLYEIVDKAVKMLEADIGPLTGLPVKTARGIVNRLSSGPEVQRFCSSAIESLDSIFSQRASSLVPDHNTVAAKLVTVAEIGSTSVTVSLMLGGSSSENVVRYNIWHRKSDDSAYAAEPTCTLFPPNPKFVLSSLTPDTNYLLKVVAFLDGSRESGTREVQFRTTTARVEVSNANSKDTEVERTESPATNCSSLSNPSSVEDETNNSIPCRNNAETRANDYLHHQTSVSTIVLNGYKGQEDEENGMSIICVDPSPDRQAVNHEKEQTAEETDQQAGKECVPSVANPGTALPITPCKFDNMKLAIKYLDNGSGKEEEEPRAGSSSKKRTFERLGDETSAADKDFEYYVKVIRWLECEGHIEPGFRQKFLTWYSLRASPEEVRVVKVFVDTFVEDPESLAGQLVDSFSDVISSKRSSLQQGGFCLKLFH